MNLTKQKTELIEKLEQKTLVSLNLFQCEDYTPESHRRFTNRIMEDVSEALDTIASAARGEVAEEIRNQLIVIQNEEIAQKPLKDNPAAQKMNDLLGKIYDKYLKP